MTDQEYEQLEHLLNKLESEVGSKICIIPNYHHGGVYIATYDKNGQIEKQVTASTIEAAVYMLQQIVPSKANSHLIISSTVLKENKQC